MLRRQIPASLIAVLAKALADAETHESLNSLFPYAGAPGDPPEGSKPVKIQAWLRRVNLDPQVDPMRVLGGLLEGVMEAELDPSDFWEAKRAESRAVIGQALVRANLQYLKGGRISAHVAAPSRTLEAMIRDRDLQSMNEEFERALRDVDTEPKQALSAACNLLESVCKIYIDDENLGVPKKQDLQSVWAVVRSDLGFEPSQVEDRDLKEILSGLIATVNGVGALRTHASTAHGAGRRRFNVQPRHARLAVHAAHTVAVFVLESWDRKKRSRGEHTT